MVWGSSYLLLNQKDSRKEEHIGWPDDHHGNPTHCLRFVWNEPKLAVILQYKRRFDLESKTQIYRIFSTLDRRFVSRVQPRQPREFNRTTGRNW